MEENFQILLDAVLRPDIGARIQKQLNSLGLSVQIDTDSKAVSDLQKQFKNVDASIDVDLGNTKNIVKDAQKVGAQAAAAINRELGNGLLRTGVKSPFSDIDTSIRIEPVLDDKGLVDLEATLQKLRKEFADFGQVTLTNQKYGLDKQLQSFTVRIQQVKGELKDITSFNMGMNKDGAFTISGDVLRRTEQMVQHLDEARNTSNETAENVQLQEQCYKQLISSTQEYYRLQTKLLKAGKENRAELEKQRDAAQAQILSARQTINNNNLMDPTREAKYESALTKGQNKYNDAATALSDRQNASTQSKYYSKMTQAMREAYSLKTQMLKADEQTTAELKKQLKAANQRITYNRSQIDKKGLQDNSLDWSYNIERDRQQKQYDIAERSISNANTLKAEKQAIDALTKSYTALQKVEMQIIAARNKGESSDSISALTKRRNNALSKYEDTYWKTAESLGIDSDVLKQWDALQREIDANTRSQIEYNDSLEYSRQLKKEDADYNKKAQQSLTELQKAYKKYQSTYTAVTNQVSQLDNTDNAGQISALYQNLDDVKSQYRQMYTEFQKLIKGNTEYAQTWIKVRDEIRNAAKAQRNLNAGIQNDKLKQTYSGIQTAVDDDQLNTQAQNIRKIVDNYKNRDIVSQPLNDILARLESAGQNITDTVKSGSVTDIKSVITQYQEWINLLKQTNKELKNLEQSSKWTSRRDSMLSDIDTYLESHSAISKDMRQNFLSLRNEINNAVQGVDLSPMSKQLSTLKKETRAAGMEGRTWFEEIRNNVGKVTDWLSATTIVMGAINKTQQMINNVRELDSAMTDLRMVTGKSIDDTQKLMSSYSDLADQLKVTVTDVASASNDWLRQGYGESDVETLTTDSIIMSKISGLDAAESTEYLTTAMKGYRVEAENALDIVDKLSAVDMASATDVGGLAEGMSRVAANAELAGVSMDKLLGYLAVIGESSGEDMSSVGRTLNAIFSRMGNIKLSRLDSYQNESGEDLSNVETVLRGEGINLRDESGQFRNFGEVLDEVAGNWNNYDSVSQRAIANAMAGTEHLSDFILLMRDYSTATDYATTAADANGEAMEKYSAYTESIEGRMEQFKNSFMSLSDAVVNSDLVKGLTSIVTVLTDMATALINVTELIPGVDGGISTLVGLAGAFFGAKGAGYVITYISTNVYKARENCYCIR